MEPNKDCQPKEPKVYPLNTLIENLSFEDYAAADGINASGLKDILRSPAHYYENKYNPIEKKETEALLFGKLLHYSILEHEMFKKRLCIEPKCDMRTKIGKETRERFEADLRPDAIVVPERMVDKLIRIGEKLAKHPLTKNVLAKGSREVSLFWNDPVTGELCKARPDFITIKERMSVMVDLKSCTDARYEAFFRQCDKLNYDLQMAHYFNGLCVAGFFKQSDSAMFIAVEKAPPYESMAWPIGVSVIARGDRKREKAMQVYHECRLSGKYPGYPQKAVTLEYPDWMMEKELYVEDEGEE
jgi:exodeoxyribonuclease VIII